VRAFSREKKKNVKREVNGRKDDSKKKLLLPQFKSKDDDFTFS